MESNYKGPMGGKKLFPYTQNRFHIVVGKKKKNYTIVVSSQRLKRPKIDQAVKSWFQILASLRGKIVG